MNNLKSFIDRDDKKILSNLARISRGDILTMTTIAASGHPGGSMSMIDMLLLVYRYANINIDNVDKLTRDRIIVSNGHTSPVVYSVLGRYGFIDIDEAKAYFRLAGSSYEGHIERSINGVEWSTGNLGQGLSAAAGAAIAGRLKKLNYNIFVFMGDGEQQKGQIVEARRFIYKYKFNNIKMFIDYNGLQISGKIESVMPQNIKAEYEADGWKVLEIDGHNFEEIYQAFYNALNIDSPVMVLAHTTMGKGVSFIENKEKYHGSPLSEEQYREAMKELDLSDELEKYRKIRRNFTMERSVNEERKSNLLSININKGNPIKYGTDVFVDNRTGFGNALYDVIKLNYDNEENTPVAVFDCDLASSTKTDKVFSTWPEIFFESGIQEHHTATMAGAASLNGIVSVFADFGVFGIDEVYNQMRLNDINKTNLKLVVTHVGIDVGEDGKTHQCIDYIGLFRNLYGFKIIIPADANQTDKALRYIINSYGNYLLAMGRSKLPIIQKEDGSVFFDELYNFEYGVSDIIRDGKFALFSYGTMLHRALKVSEILKEQGIDIAVVNIACPLSIDILQYKKYIDNGIIFVYEDHNKNTGLASILAGKLCELNYKCKIKAFGVDGFGFSGNPDSAFNLMGIGVDNLVSLIKKELILHN
jgi:transketolase